MIICYLLIAAMAAALVWLYRHTALEFGKISREFEDLKKQLREFSEEADAAVNKLGDRVTQLEQGVVPDFEEAKAAVRAVNDFNTGLTNIMEYDPMAAIKRTRQGEGETE